MKLRVIKNINKSVITVEVETTDFTDKENEMLNIIGEPMITFEKTYGISMFLSIKGYIRRGFKFKVKFDGSTEFDDLISANISADTFINEDLPLELSNAMAKVKETYNSLPITTPPSYIEIKY